MYYILTFRFYKHDPHIYHPYPDSTRSTTEEKFWQEKKK